MNAAWKTTLLEHARDGMPVYVWRGGQVVALDARTLLAEEAAAAPATRSTNR